MNIWNEVNKIAENLLSVYEQLIELSEEIQYMNKDCEGNAGDELKLIVSEMMVEIQKLKPVDY